MEKLNVVIADDNEKMLDLLGNLINEDKELELDVYKRQMYGNPEFQIREKRTRLLDLENRIQSAMEAQIFYARQNLSIYIERMKGLSPLEKLNQGFSYVENQKGSAITSISQVKAGEELSIQVTDGTKMCIRDRGRTMKLLQGMMKKEKLVVILLIGLLLLIAAFPIKEREEPEILPEEINTKMCIRDRRIFW